MANFVKSVERITTSFTADGTTTVDLGKGQDETQCVPFITCRNTGTGVNDSFGNRGVRAIAVDNSGTAAIQFDFNADGTVNTVTVECFVVEYGSNVTIQTGGFDLTDTGSTGVATITAVVLANSFITFTQEASAGTSDDFGDSYIQAGFNSTTQIQLERRIGGGPDWNIRWYVIESDGTDFTTEYIEHDWTSDETAPTAAITSVTTTKAFLVCSYEASEPSDDPSDAHYNHVITSATVLTSHGEAGNTIPACTSGIWVVKTTGTEFSVQRFDTLVSTSASTTETITEIDQDKAIILGSSNLGILQGLPQLGGTAGEGNDLHNQTLIFSSDTQVTCQRASADDPTGTNNTRYEVVEFELEAAAAGVLNLVMAPYGPAA